MTIDVAIIHRGVPMTISGDFIEPIKEVIRADPGESHPAEGGYFEEYSILVEGHDVTELLAGRIKDEILEEANNIALNLLY